MPADDNSSIAEPKKKWRFGFWSLIATQFQDAFNDDGLEFLVIFVMLGGNPSDSGKDWLVFVIGNLFALPFLLFSMAGGFLGDRFSKRSVTIATKIFEVCAMLFAMYAFTRGNTRMAYAVIFLASTQAAFFGPSKYGLLPELLPDKLLSWGNGILELTTFLAIIAGAVIGPSLAQHFHGREAIAGLIFGACSLLGLAASFGISRVPPADPSKKFSFNIFGDLNKQIQLVRPDRVLHLAIAGNTYFWFLGALLQFVIVFRSEEHTSELQSHLNLVCRLPPSSTLFPYPPLFRSLGWAASLFFSRAPPADPSKKFSFNIFGDLNKQIQLVRPDRVLHLAIAGNTYFWFLGALLQFVIVFYGREVLHLDETRGGYLQAALPIGI